jgi:cytochrome b
MFFCVLKQWHPMVGIDYHTANPPPPAPPVPFAPYATSMLLFGSGITCKYAPTSMTHGFSFTMLRGTDIGPSIPHIGPPSLTILIEILLSGSKSHFGPSAHVARDQYGESGPIGAALMVTVNPNLNCGYPIPTPTGFVLAITTHVTGMTLGDICAGLSMMAWDCALQAVLNAIGEGLGKWLGKGLGAIGERLGWGALTRAAARQLCRAQGVRSGMNAMMRSLLESNRAKGAAVARGVALINAVWGRLAAPVMFGLGGPIGPSLSNVHGSDGKPLVKAPYDRATGNENILNPERDANEGGKAIDQSGAGHAVNGYLDGPEEGPTELFP